MSEILGELYAKQGKYEEGLRAFDAYFASTKAPSADARYLRGLCRMGLYDYEGAIEDMTAALNSGRRCAAALYRRGLCRMQLGALKAAEADFSAAIDARPTMDGARYNRDTLDVHYKGKNISDVLEMTVEEGLAFFDGIPAIQRKLQTLYDVGLGYVKIGQSSTTLSGGEAQRVKLATELAKRGTGKTIYILDEPTTGLHSADVAKLLEILQRLCDGGNTVLVIEHNLDVIKSADRIIDLGPEGGDGGGTLLAEGTPEDVAKVEASYTGQYLKKWLAKDSVTGNRENAQMKS